MFEQFVKERVYLKNVSPRTVDFYRDCGRSFERYGGELTKAVLLSMSRRCVKQW